MLPPKRVRQKRFVTCADWRAVSSWLARALTIGLMKYVMARP